MDVKQQIVNKIENFDKIILHRHISPDPDALGSTLGLKHLIQDNFEGKQVFVVGYQEKNLEWMGALDKVEEAVYEDALVIVLDTANSGRIDNKNYKLGKTIIKIDHHPGDDHYGHLNFINVKAASVCEMVLDLARAANWTISLEAATLLYAGIVSDTGRFLYDTVTSDTFEAAGFLIDLGVDVNALSRNLYKRPLNVLKATAYVLNNFEMTEHGVAYFKMTKDEQDEFGLTTGTRSMLVDVLSGLEGVLVRVCFFEQKSENSDHQIRANIRSEGPIINELAERFNGGGHAKASGAMLKSWEVCEDLITELDLLCQYFHDE